MKTLLCKLKLRPEQIIVAGFVLLILLGALLLRLPVSVQAGKHVSFLNALFTSTSAVCVTGLVTVDTSTTYTLFGQIVIIALIQMGGLGVMTVMSTVFIILGKRITLSERILIQNQLGEDNISGMVRLILRVLRVTAIAEGTGAALLMTRFVPMYGLKGVYYSVFHAVSAFCNAGFDVFGKVKGPFSSLTGFANDPVVVGTVMLLVISGGLGFVVVADIFSPVRIRKRQKLTRYSRFVIILTAILILGGAGLFFLFELPNPDTLGSKDLTAAGKILGGFFQSVTPRTAGFNTISQNAMTPAGKLVTMVLMFIGASPSGTGGGIKTTTFAILLLFVFSTIAGRKEPRVFDRRLAADTIRRAVAITVLSLLLVGFAFLIVVGIEGKRGGLFTFENIFFEVLSAFGTVGLTSGLTPQLSAASRMVIIFVMFAGRGGFMTMVVALSRRNHKEAAIVRYPEARFMVG
jgi:trk system potassium uptake protein TrkH